MPARKERLFYTGSARIIGDPRPSGLDMRVYACVSLHDGMSLLKRSGRGCYATFETLTGELGCDPANLSRSLKRLVQWGYLTEERQSDRRMKAYRVTFETAESWRNRQQSNVGETANDLPKFVDGAANEPTEIVGNELSGNGSFLAQDEEHYSSLKELNSPEGEKLNSTEVARRSARQARQEGLGHSVGAHLARLERQLKDDPHSLDINAWLAWLDDVRVDQTESPANVGRAARLAEELVGLDAALDEWYALVGSGQ